MPEEVAQLNERKPRDKKRAAEAQGPLRIFLKFKSVLFWKVVGGELLSVAESKGNGQ